MRPVQPDDKLAAIVGSQPLPRSELTKKLWNYIKKHGCQDKKKRTMINADDSLRPVFNGKSQVSMFEMTKLARSICGNAALIEIGKKIASSAELYLVEWLKRRSLRAGRLSCQGKQNFSTPCSKKLG